MKKIIVYYSLGEHTKCAAEAAAAKLGADLLRLEPAKPYPKENKKQYPVCGFQAIFGIKKKLKPYKFNADAYDTVILAAPIWAGKPATPIMRFVSEQKLAGKKVGVIACSASGAANGFFKKFRKCIPGIRAELSLIEPTPIKIKEKNAELDNFCAKLTAKEQ